MQYMKIAAYVFGHVMELCKDEYASLVVEKCLTQLPVRNVMMMIDALEGDTYTEFGMQPKLFVLSNYPSAHKILMHVLLHVEKDWISKSLMDYDPVYMYTESQPVKLLIDMYVNERLRKIALQPLARFSGETLMDLAKDHVGNYIIQLATHDSELRNTLLQNLDLTRLSTTVYGRYVVMSLISHMSKAYRLDLMETLKSVGLDTHEAAKDVCAFCVRF